VSDQPQSSAHGAWWVQVRGQAYGPYSDKQMAGFVAEGRVRPASMVAQDVEGPWAEARTFAGLMAEAPAARSLATAKPTVEAGNLFIHAEINSGAHGRFMSALESVGLVVDMAPGLWLVRTRQSAGVVRNMLSQTLQQGDRFIVIDASRDRLAWFNLGPEVDVRIKDVWNGPAPAAAPQR